MAVPIERIRVASRIRPLSEEEISCGDEVVTHLFDDSCLVVEASNGLHPTKSFKLDAIFDEQHTQDDVFKEIRPMLDCAVVGYNCCICTYGQTGSGKTFTMLGVDMV